MQLTISQELLKKLLDIGFDRTEIVKVGIEYSKLQHRRKVDLDTMSVKHSCFALKVEVLHHLGFTMETIAHILKVPRIRVSRIVDDLTASQICIAD